MPSPVSVAVIGAGAAGLIAALELRGEGHQVVVYERGDQIGGTWVYTDETDSDTMGLNPTRRVVHSSLYASLRTNLPREMMGYRVYPFVATGEPGRDSRRFPDHREVLEYLKDFAKEFGLEDLVRLGRQVWDVRMMEDLGLKLDPINTKTNKSKWVVKSRKTLNGIVEEEEGVYDAVVVCVGRNSEPRIAEIPGIDVWPGKQIHSHNYRHPDPYRHQIVVIIGASSSGEDLSREISKVANQVHIASRYSLKTTLQSTHAHNIWLHPMVLRLDKDGNVVFEDQTQVYAHVIIHCTGYKFHFPFLMNSKGINVRVDDNQVYPLYKHIFPPALAPGISFVGVAWRALPLRLFELQSKWIARVLSGRNPLPSMEEMKEEVEGFYAWLEASGIPKRYSHSLEATHTTQFEYEHCLAAQTHSHPPEEWRRKMFNGTRLRMKTSPLTYRDLWDDHHLILQGLSRLQTDYKLNHPSSYKMFLIDIINLLLSSYVWKLEYVKCFIY